MAVLSCAVGLSQTGKSGAAPTPHDLLSSDCMLHTNVATRLSPISRMSLPCGEGENLVVKDIQVAIELCFVELGELSHVGKTLQTVLNHRRCASRTLVHLSWKIRVSLRSVLVAVGITRVGCFVRREFCSFTLRPFSVDSHLTMMFFDVLSDVLSAICKLVFLSLYYDCVAAIVRIHLCICSPKLRTHPPCWITLSSGKVVR